MSDHVIHSAIILAAGKNTRFDTGIPKCLHKVDGITLLERHIRELHKIHCHNIAVVVGSRGEVIEKYIHGLNEALIMPVDIVWNSAYEKGNAYSILAAVEWVKQQNSPYFFCTMSDHIYDSNFYHALFKSIDRIRNLPLKIHPGLSILNLAVDKVDTHNAHIDLLDVTKVQLHEVDRFLSTIGSIGKELTDYNYFDTGFFVLKPDVFDEIREAMREVGDGISNTVTYLTKKNQASALDITGHYWNDVDTPEDYMMVMSHINRLNP